LYANDDFYLKKFLTKSTSVSILSVVLFVNGEFTDGFEKPIVTDIDVVANNDIRSCYFFLVDYFWSFKS
jgi:hypothetical protein